MKLEYGEILKDTREYNGVTQQELANAIGISRGAYNQFEHQYDIIPIKRLNQVSNYLNVSIDYLLGLTKKKYYNNSKDDINMEIASKRLKEFRKENKLTQEKLAEKLNIPRSVILYHELKRTTLGTPFLYELCSKYSISADYLLGKIDKPKYLKETKKLS